MLVTATEVVQTTFTNQKTDPALIRDSVIVATELAYLKPMLGEELYKEVIEEAPSGQIEVLRDSYCKPLLCWLVKSAILPELVYKSASAGLVQKRTESTEPNGEMAIAILRREALQKADGLLQGMLAFIETNSADYPAYMPIQKPPSILSDVITY